MRAKPRAATAAASRQRRASDAKRDHSPAAGRELAQALTRIEQLQASAETDFLLGIPNRRGFERELNRAIAYIKRYHASGALIVLDVDRLKPINDAFGHGAGDRGAQGDRRVLTAAGPRLRCDRAVWVGTSSRCCCGI